MSEYLPRLVDKELARQLKIGAVLIEGAKWCGKTWTARQKANSEFLMNDPEHQEQNIELAKNSPLIALEGATPRLIDEWQIVPKLWDAIRFEVDRRGEPNQFILTGSAVPVDTSTIHHTGTGRITHLLMRPMSLFESKESTGEVCLHELFETPGSISGSSTLGLRDLAHIACRGGWPRAISDKTEDNLIYAEAYFNGVVNDDMSRVDNVKRSPAIARKILRSYARNIGQPVALEAIRRDVEAGDGSIPGIDSVYSYVEVLRKIYVIEDSPSWNPNIRSKAAIRATETRYLVDPSIATQALEISPEDLINDLKTFGFVFENLCMRDLRVYTEAIGGHVDHYRDSNGLECDAVVHIDSGKYGLVQIKLGADSETLDEAAKTLQNLANNIDATKMSMPSFKMVLCGNAPYAYRREDGVYIVPIGCLKP